MKELNHLQNIIFRVGAIAFVIGLGIRLFNPLLGMWLYVAGVLGFTTMQLLQRYEGSNFNIARLRRQQIMSDIAFLLSAAAMMSQDLRFGPAWAHRNTWTLLLIVGCVLQLYTAFRLPQEIQKDNDRRFNGGSAMILLLPFLLNSCATQYNVEGTTNVSMLEGKMLYLKVFDNESMHSLDSCTVQHGRIHFNGTLDSTQMVNIFMDDESMMPMVLEGGVISLTIDESKQDVTGSPLNDTLYNFIRAKVRLDRELDALPSLESKLIMDGVDEMERNSILYSESQRIAEENDKLVTSFIVRNSDNVLGPGVFMIMTSGFAFPQTTPQIEEIMFRAKPYFKNHPYVKSYMEAAEKNMEKIHTGEGDKE